jgi:hypothetical protein
LRIPTPVPSMKHNHKAPENNETPVPVARLAVVPAIHRRNLQPVVASSKARVAHEVASAVADARLPAEESSSSSNLAASIRARERRREYFQRLQTAVEAARERSRRLEMIYRALHSEDADVEGGGGGGHGQQDPSMVDEGATAEKRDDWEWREGLGDDEDSEGQDGEDDEVDTGKDVVKNEGEDDAGQQPRAKHLRRVRE